MLASDCLDDEAPKNRPTNIRIRLAKLFCLFDIYFVVSHQALPV